MLGCPLVVVMRKRRESVGVGVSGLEEIRRGAAVPDMGSFTNPAAYICALPARRALRSIGASLFTERT